VQNSHFFPARYFLNQEQVFHKILASIYSKQDQHGLRHLIEEALQINKNLQTETDKLCILSMYYDLFLSIVNLELQKEKLNFCKC
jgi:hypothetical protein